MKPRGFLLPLSLIILAAVGGTLAAREVLVLQVMNTDRAGKLNIRTEKSSLFALSYIHSIYDQPATEEFEVGEGDEIILRGVRTRSPAVAAYYGFVDGRDYYPVNRRMKSFSLRLGMANPQILSFGDRQISMGELGEKGDRLIIRCVRMSWGRYVLSFWKKEKG